MNVFKQHTTPYPLILSAAIRHVFPADSPTHSPYISPDCDTATVPMLDARYVCRTCERGRLGGFHGRNVRTQFREDWLTGSKVEGRKCRHTHMECGPCKFIFVLRKESMIRVVLKCSGYVTTRPRSQCSIPRRVKKTFRRLPSPNMRPTLLTE